MNGDDIQQYLEQRSSMLGKKGTRVLTGTYNKCNLILATQCAQTKKQKLITYMPGLVACAIGQMNDPKLTNMHHNLMTSLNSFWCVLQSPMWCSCGWCNVPGTGCMCHRLEEWSYSHRHCSDNPQGSTLVPSVRDWREGTLGKKISTIQTKQTRKNSVTQKPQITWSTWKGNSWSNHCKCATQHHKSAQTLNINRYMGSILSDLNVWKRINTLHVRCPTSWLQDGLVNNERDRNLRIESVHSVNMEWLDKCLHLGVDKGVRIVFTKYQACLVLNYIKACISYKCLLCLHVLEVNLFNCFFQLWYVACRPPADHKWIPYFCFLNGSYIIYVISLCLHHDVMIMHLPTLSCCLSLFSLPDFRFSSILSWWHSVC